VESLVLAKSDKRPNSQGSLGNSGRKLLSLVGRVRAVLRSRLARDVFIAASTTHALTDLDNVPARHLHLHLSWLRQVVADK
jgi:hypothetical protein